MNARRAHALLAAVMLAAGPAVAGPPCTDAHDPNESCGPIASVLAAGNYTDLRVAGFFDAGDVDWYRVPLRRSDRLTATVTYPVAPGDAEIDLLTDDCLTVVAMERSGANLVHSISFVNDGANAHFKLATGHYDAATCHEYALSIVIENTGNMDNTVTYPGWTAPVVPRNDATATLPSTVLSPTLNGNAATTHFNWTIRQTGPAALPQWETRMLVDLEPIGGVLTPLDPAPPQDYSVGNSGPFPVRGGRHTLTSVTDLLSLVPETNESDNAYSAQYVWSPLVTSWGNPNVRGMPPDPGLLALANNDGFAFTRNVSYAWVVGLAARDPSDDYDLQVFDDYSGSMAGFSNPISGSANGSNFTDFVVGHYSGTPVTVYPGVHRSSITAGDDFAIDQIDARFRNGPLPDGPADFPAQTMGANRVVDVYEALMNAGSTFYLTLHRTAGASDLSFEVYPGSVGGAYGRGSGATSSPLSPDTDVLTYVATVNGWHPIVVFRENGSGAADPATYEFHWSKVGFVGTPGGPSPGGLAFLGARPNPLSESGRLEFVLPHAGRVALALFDAGGRRVRALADRTFEAGPQSVTWDGLGDDGGRLPAGVYWARLRFETGRLTKRVVVL